MFENCLYMPELGINLISQSQLNKQYYSIFNNTYTYIKNNNNQTIIKGIKIKGLYILDIIPYKNINNNNNIQILATIEDKSINKMDLYIKLGHISLNYLDKVIKNTVGYNNIISNNIINTQILNCETCL
jgi:hypothetical protein